MTASSSSDLDTISDINVTPLVDIALVLLIVFLVTAKLVVSSALDIRVPRASHTSALQSPLTLELGADGRVLVGGTRATSDATIVAAAREAHARNPEVRAILRADGAVPHARVVRAIDLLKDGGVTQIAFGVDRTGPPPPLVVEGP
jgi:biopolymer transport protein ExbD